MSFSRWSSIYGITIIVAFCSIVYELLLAQTLSAFMGNTILRYSITIGLYMASMGVGAFLVKDKVEKIAAFSLMRVEFLLSLIGGSSVMLFFIFDFLGLSGAFLLLVTHALIIIIGILTGMEIPLLIFLREREKESTENVVLGFDYIGALLGTILFAFVFYPVIGIFATAFIVAFLNALAGIAIYRKRKTDEIRNNKYSFFLSANIILGIVLFICLLASSWLQELFINKYIII